MHFLFPLGAQLAVSSKDMPEIAEHHKNSHHKNSQTPNPANCRHHRPWQLLFCNFPWKNKSWFCCSLSEVKEIYPRFIPGNFSTYLKPLIIYSWQNPYTLTLFFLVGDGKWELNASVLSEQWMLFSMFHIIMSRLISQFKYWVYKKRIPNMENYTSNQNILEYMFSDHNCRKTLEIWNWVYIFTVFLILS